MEFHVKNIAKRFGFLIIGLVAFTVPVFAASVPVEEMLRNRDQTSAYISDMDSQPVHAVAETPDFKDR